ncbi:hypothetical protein [Pseudomonas sp. OTU750018]|uniref:hypothetical protein n=1 Tax=Pseudomonas sp. OTU750018 TaxID=2709708 RepID=UPI0014241E67|nr:hypothetical protein [Pseudomonas sp. OTU750018]
MSSVIVVKHGFRRAVIAAGLRGAPGAGGGGSAGVSSFNTRTGIVTLTGADVTGALSYTPANNASLAGVAFSGAYADLSGRPSLAAVALSGAYADLSGAPFIPAAPGDIGAATSAQGALADTAVQPAALTVQLDLKVDKIAGYGLSQENYTAAEKAKLAGLEGSHYRGTYLNLTALQTALPTASAGDYADVDAGTADPVQRYIWDDSDGEWVAQAGSADPITAAQVKTLYESNADTNAYTDAEKTKLAGIAAGATANADTDSLSEGTTNKWFTVARVLDAVLGGLSLVTGSAVVNTDSIQVAIGKLQKQITDLTTVVAGKQATLVSGTNIKTVNGSSLLGSGDLVVSGGAGSDWGDIGGTLADQTDLQAALTARALVAGLPSRTITASGAVTPADAGKWLICTSATPITLTIGAEATAAWTTSGILPMFHVLQVGAGAVTVTGAGFSVTLHASDTNVLAGAGAAATALWRASNTWSLIGRLVAA